METDRLTQLQQVQVVPAQQVAATELAPFPKKCTISNLVKRPPVNIEFHDLKFTTHNAKGETRHILNGISGRFLSGELSCILGPSGAGKTTLMNILIGYLNSNVSGTIQTNGQPRNLRLFHKLSCYIMQDDLLQPRITVHEAMMVAAELKLGSEMSARQKALAVDEVLETLGLTPCRNTRTEKLSGGQRKRLAVALELVNNPPVIFLDEPTTGLDVVAMKALVDVLQLLARGGRTVVCTIHQPSASLFQQFDHVYILNGGNCVYQGAAHQLVPFLDACQLSCPKHYNPADFVLECLSPNNAKTMAANTSNGKLCKTSSEPAKHVSSYRTGDSAASLLAAAHAQTSALSETEFATSFWTQLSVLTRRYFLQTRRNMVGLFVQMFGAVLVGASLGAVFYGKGDDVTRPFDNFKFCIGVLVYYMYCPFMVPILLFPSELVIMKREFFNRWYGLKSYYIALTFSTLPWQCVCGFVFSTMCYVISGQPMVWSRYLWFLVTGVTTGMVSEGYGLVLGSLFSVTNGSTLGTFSLAPMLVLSVYGMGYGKNAELIYEWLMSLSYLRFGLVGFALSLYSGDRDLMHCDEDKVVYCHYANPNLLLRDLGMEGLSSYMQMLNLLVYMVVFRLAAFLALRYRLTVEFSSRILNYLRKIIPHK
ncbi:ATP-binding cassette subfamily G member 4 [Frankliniella occidentalis]|uniref:ATP-binding cassette subfamily G member 4 n=2 Tax=Frankliniella occidentalis TaxID=133901 RepID=A0A9C6XCY2_FRAOC|nr:ATP-binding cassette subfamily G member 4 [Frankliniella occidentalis]